MSAVKKYLSVLVFVIVAMAFTVSFASSIENDALLIANNAQLEEIYIRVLEFPASLEVIEEEAFEGTAIVNVKIPETVTTISDRAFANIPTLRSIRIPLATTQIASNAFAGSNNVTINAAPDSYARKYAKAHGLPFSPVTMFCAENQGTISVNITVCAHIDIDTVSADNNIPERQWQKLEEINVIGTLDIIFNDIQGRGPPMGEVEC